MRCLSIALTTRVTTLIFIMASFREEVLTLDLDYDKEEERSDSLITHCNETEPEANTAPIDHATPITTSVILMNSYFDFIYARALCEVKGSVIRKKRCHGCEINHPSQRHHDCLWGNENDNVDDDDDDEHNLDMYFNDMLEAVNEKAILLSWEDIVRISNISTEVIDLHKMVISSKDFLNIMKTELWRRKMKRMVLTITRLDKRLFQS